MLCYLNFINIFGDFLHLSPSACTAKSSHHTFQAVSMRLLNDCHHHNNVLLRESALAFKYTALLKYIHTTPQKKNEIFFK